MCFKSFEEIMRYALDREQEAATFYEEASKKEQYAGARETFSDLAKEEHKHEATLARFSRENMETYNVEKVPDLKISDYLVDLEYEPGMPYLETLRFAAKCEEKAFKLYAELGDKTANEDHKKLFKALAQEEAKHKLKLETLLDDYMAEIGG
jgi:rubrerythrin